MKGVDSKGRMGTFCKGKHLVQPSRMGGGFDGKGAFSSCPFCDIQTPQTRRFQTWSDIVEGVMWLVGSGQFKNNENQAEK